MAVTRAVLGPVSAYQEAVAGGYTGTEAEFRVYIATVAQNAQAANQSKIDAAKSKTDAESAATRAETAAELAEARAYYDPLLIDEIPGTVQEIVLDAAGNVAGMTHKKEGVTVRTDAYTKTATTVTETRTLEDGRGIVIETNLETKVTTITEVE